MADFNSIAQQFVQFYYTTFDTNRAGLFPLYTPESMLTFEGEQFRGAQSIVAKILELSCTSQSPDPHNRRSAFLHSSRDYSVRIWSATVGR
jgi:hypothetical protein